MGDDEVLRRINYARWLLRLADAGELDGDYSRPVVAEILAEAEAEWAWRQRRDLHKPSSAPTGYPDALLRDIKARINLVHVVETDGFALRRASQTWRGPCPGHDSRSGASFTVFMADPDDEHFDCFGCGATGDVFDWLTTKRALTFRQAVEGLAAILSIDLTPALLADPAPASGFQFVRGQVVR